MKKLYIFGTSGFARETRDIAHVLGWQCVFVAASAAAREAWRGSEPVVLEADLGEHLDGAYTIGIADNKARAKIAARYSGRLSFINLIHPSATFGAGQQERLERMGTGVLVCAGARFMNNIDVGNFTIFNLNCTVGHDAVIGDFVTVAPGANISGYVNIQEGCWIGTGAAINQGREGSLLTIGAGTVIGSGSVVVKDCEPESTYIGIPAKKR